MGCTPCLLGGEIYVFRVVRNLLGMPLSAAAVDATKGMSFYVKTLTGRIMVMDGMFPASTVADIKTKIERMKKIPRCQQRLIFGGSQLQDEQTLPSKGIGHENTISLVLGLRKPVILLYPMAPLDVSVIVQLSRFWKFPSLYPKPSNSKELR